LNFSRLHVHNFNGDFLKINPLFATYSVYERNASIINFNPAFTTQCLRVSELARSFQLMRKHITLTSHFTKLINYFFMLTFQ